ncbi:S8 family peptidase [Micromonospora sp. NPDC023956]|uniref:S8 family peptidase n=1 Tax=Micromonospora sp. NPDC023956 TaxID=3155722 RepID=UPI0033C6214E
MMSLGLRRHRLAAAGVLAASALVAATVGAPATAAPAVDEIMNDGGATAVAGSYLVVLTDAAVGGPAGTRVAAVSERADALARRYGGKVGHRYGHALNGFEVRLPEATARRLAADPAVAWVEQNHTMRATATQPGPPWNLDRIDQRTAAPDGGYSYTGTGHGIPVYVVDSGIRITHTQFGGRASYGYDVVDVDPVADDCTGHGTHTAGVVGGSTYGVAKSARLIAVRVLDCSDTTTLSTVIHGLEWLTDHHVTGQPAVALMNVVGVHSTALNSAVQFSISSGISYAVAAGNDNANACSYSPAPVATAIRVGATQPDDTRAGFSNYGTCVDLHAPGVNVLSAWHTGTAASAFASGTSAAAPHVAGAAARVLQRYPTWSPSQVKAYLTGQTTPVGNLRLLYLDPLL